MAEVPFFYILLYVQLAGQRTNYIRQVFCLLLILCVCMAGYVLFSLCMCNGGYHQAMDQPTTPRSSCHSNICSCARRECYLSQWVTYSVSVCFKKSRGTVGRSGCFPCTEAKVRPKLPLGTHLFELVCMAGGPLSLCGWYLGS